MRLLSAVHCQAVFFFSVRGSCCNNLIYQLEMSDLDTKEISYARINCCINSFYVYSVSVYHVLVLV